MARMVEEMQSLMEQQTDFPVRQILGTESLSFRLSTQQSQKQVVLTVVSIQFLKKELPRLRKLKEDGRVDYYLLFTNRKLSGVQDPKIEDFFDKEVGVKNRVLGEETIQLWLRKYSEIAKILGLNKLLLPLQFYEKDLQEIVIAFSEAKISKEKLGTIQSDLTRIPIEEKNRLNNLSKTYFDEVLKESYSDFDKIKKFPGRSQK